MRRAPRTAAWILLGLVFLGLHSSWARAANYYIDRSTNDPASDIPLVPDRIYDGSNADRVDDFLSRVPENSSIYFGNHVFETRGVWDNWLVMTAKRGFKIKTGWKIIGKGTNDSTGTIIKLIDVPVDKSGLYEHNAVFSTGAIGLYAPSQPPLSRPNVEQVTIRDLQIDCNYPALAKEKGKNVQLAGIQLLGNRGLRIENVWIRRSVSRKYGIRGQNLEGFMVYAYNPWADHPPGDYFIDRVVITEFGGGYTSAICVNGNATGIIQNCWVDLDSDNSQRYGLNFAAKINGFTIRSNTVLNATRGINNDTGPNCTNVLIQGNQFLRCSTGLLLADSQRTRVIGNTFSLLGNGSGVLIRYHPDMEDVKSRECVVQDNTFSAPGGEGVTLCYRNEYDSRDLTLHWSSNNIIQNNVFLGELQNKVPPESIARNILRPGNRRHVANYPACNNGGKQGNIVAIGFPSEIGPGTDCAYCEARALESSFGFISHVRLRGTGIDMRSDWGDGTGYTDFTTGYPMGVGESRRQRAYQVQWADVHRGRVYQMEIEASALGPRRSASFHVYIDLDHDGVFHPDKELVATGWSKNSVNTEIAIPTSAAVGSTRMRIIMAGGQAPTPCQTKVSWGEVEDYTLNIVR